MAAPILVGYRKFYTFFACCLLVSRYIYKMNLSYTAFVWAAWIFIWTSPPVLSAILELVTKRAQKDDHYTAVYQSHSKEHRPRSSPDIRKTVNATTYYIIHFYTVSQAFAFVNVAGPMPGPELTWFRVLIKTIGWIVCLCGFVGCLWSRFYLGSEWRGAPEVRDDHKLITTGPYAITRHPIYTSLFLMLIGSALTTMYWLPVLEVIVAVIAYTVKAVAEEKMLLSHFGESYAKYQRTVYMLMPYIH